MASICPSLRGGFVPEFKRDLVIFTLDGWCPFVPQGFFAAAMKSCFNLASMPSRLTLISGGQRR